MPWGPRKNSEICAIHAALVPTANGDGEIIYFGGDEHSPPALLAGQIDKSRRMNCRTEAVTYVASPPADLFCCGHGFMADGRLLVGGGTATFETTSPGEHGMLGHFTAERRCWVYNPHAPGFSQIARFGPEPGHEEADTGGGRWYPTILTLPSGQILAAGGHPAGDDSRHGNNTPERYLPATNSWVRLPAVGISDYARMHVLPDGLVLVVAGTFKYNAWTGAQTPVASGPGSPYDGYLTSSVLLPLLPEETYRARILVTGGVNPRKIDLGATTPAWANTGARTGSAAGKLRFNGGAVLLPTGKVLVVGGVQDGADDNTGVKEPELYDPVSDSWQTLEDPAQQVRNYHSTALLMPDGRVWTGGSNVNSARTEGGNERRVLNFEIFSPPYPAGSRPTITGCPANVAYGQRFTVQTPQAGTIARVALLRCGSMTHAFDGDQRWVGLSIVERHSGSLEVLAPLHGGVAPPGPYMVFLIDEGGRPCQYARFVRVGGDMYVITDRSHFSEMEVDSMSSPATFLDAFYVVLDGFLAADAGLPSGPAVSFEWADGGGGTVPSMTHRLESTLFEIGSAAVGVAQKIVLVYSVQFANDAAFAALGVAELRPVTVIVRSGSHESRGSFVLFKRKNPYLIDGNPHWLSMDLRVLQIVQDERLASITQGSGPTAPFDFLNGVLTEFRNRPEGGTHPFERDLEREQERSPLELASQVGGKRVYNYAFARVRYRAPMGQNADNVRVFFRLFTTAAASLEFRPGTYPVNTQGATVRPLIGLAGNEVASLPFFAAARGTNLETQDDPQNVRNLPGTGNDEIEYFGCWLDFNQATPRYREHPTSDGVGGTGDLWSLQQHIRGQHQCLVAELRFADDPIPAGATPGDNDNLAQRNLMIVESSNPAGGPGHRVQHTFELRPSDAWFPGAALQPAPAAGQDFAHAARAQAAAQERFGPDQLLIRWGNLPRDSVATLYLPDVDLRELIEVAALRPGAGMLRQADAHTLECRIGDVTLLPIPGNRATNIPGLLSIQLPETVRVGQRFRVSLHQISGRLRKVTGAWQLTIPVSHGPLLLADEQRKLSVLRHIALAIRPQNRWAPVFARYLDEIAARVRAFGGNPDLIEPSPDGTGERPGQGDGGPVDEEGRRLWTGKVSGIFYDCFGDFEGFALALCQGGQRHFRTRHRALEQLVHRACREEALLTVTEGPGGAPEVGRIVWHCE
jgi:hypothetical protein